MLRRLYDWCIAAADKPHATWLLGVVSFVESSFFPVPPDAMLIPMAIARPDKAWFYATVCTITSVAGVEEAAGQLAARAAGGQCGVEAAEAVSVRHGLSSPLWFPAV